MARTRTFGTDVEFCEWLRNCTLLPSYSPTCGFVASDTDLIIHRYMTCVDSEGTRDVQGLMMLEVKTRGGVPSASQLDTLKKWNLFQGVKKAREYVRNFGVSILSLSGTTPDNSDYMRWGRFTIDGVAYRHIVLRELVELLRFERHPDSLELTPFRRHHLTRQIVTVETTPLGFDVEKPITVRS